MLSQMLKPQKVIQFTYNPQVLSEYGPEEFNHLMECVRNVLVEESIRQNIDEEEHKKFIYIILNELKLAESNFKDKINDHCLNPDQNRDLRLKIYMCIGDVCLDLFRLYSRKAREMDNRGVYTSIPNKSRVRTELATETAKLLDVFAIRHAIKKRERLRWMLSYTELPMRYQYREKKIRHWHIGNLFKQEVFVKNMFQKFFSKYGSTYPGKLYSDYYKYRMEIFELMQGKSRGEDLENVSESETSSIEIIQMKASKFTEMNVIKRYTSEPRLYFGESIFEELDIQLSSVLRKSKSLLAMHLLDTKEDEQQTRDLAKDLEKLAQRDDVEPDVEELLKDDLPPVIKSVVQDDKRKLARAKLQRTIQTLEQLQRENKKKEGEVKAIEPIFTQPDIMTVHFQRKDTVRISSVLVTERSLQVSPVLEIFKPQYNELLREIPSSIADEIDQMGDDRKQLEELYEKLNAILEEFEIKESFSQLEKAEDIFECPDDLNLKFYINSSTLNLRPRIINEKLMVCDEPPWKGIQRETWELAPQTPRKHHKVTIHPRHPMIMMQGNTVDVKKQNEWKAWWLSFFNASDCLKYISHMDTDFLHVVFHLFDDDKYIEVCQTIEEEKRVAQVLKIEKEVAAAEAEKKVEELRRKKSLYEEGFWNADTILLGGLGSDPSSLKDSLSDEKAEDIDIPSGEDEKDTSLKTISAEDISVKPDSEKPKRVSKRLVSVRRHRIPGPIIDDGLAKRMNVLWEALEMPDGSRNKMALRYSTNERYSGLSEMLTDWEKVVNLIIQREILISKLEEFERRASDPNRFFVRVPGAGGVERLREARERSFLYKQIEELDKKLIPSIKLISKKYNETVTFQNRPYMEKMKYDRIEMLYYLQEERKVNAIHYEASCQGIPLITQYLDLENLPSKSPTDGPSVAQIGSAELHD